MDQYTIDSIETRGPGIGPLIQLQAQSMLDSDIVRLGKESDAHTFKTDYLQYHAFNMQYHTSDILHHPFSKTLIYEIPKQSHLIKSINMFVNLHSLTSGVYWTNGIGYLLIKNIRIRCDTGLFYNIPFEYLHVKNALSSKTSRKSDLFYGCFNVENSLIEYSAKDNVIILQIPLFEYFPLLAISNNDLRIELDINSLNNLICVCSEDQEYIHCSIHITNNDMVNSTLKSEINIQTEKQFKYFSYQFMIDYIELDNAEYLLFKQNKLQYNIEQLNYKRLKVRYNSMLYIDLDEFKNPTTQIIVTVELFENHNYNRYLKYQDIESLTVVLNGIKRKNKISGKLFKNNHRNSNYSKNIYSIPFGLNTSEFKQPNGTYNFSETKNNFIELFLKPEMNNKIIIVNVYGPCYNQVEVHKGHFKVLFT